MVLARAREGEGGRIPSNVNIKLGKVHCVFSRFLASRWYAMIRSDLYLEARGAFKTEKPSTADSESAVTHHGTCHRNKKPSIAHALPKTTTRYMTRLIVLDLPVNQSALHTSYQEISQALTVDHVNV